jgi:hypothetical protein
MTLSLAFRITRPQGDLFSKFPHFARNGIDGHFAKGADISQKKLTDNNNLAGKRACETPKSPVSPVVISTIGRNLNSTQ